MAKGIPREEIAFIHEAGTEIKKAELFAKVRSGNVRILLGSTPKLGSRNQYSGQAYCPPPSGLPLEAGGSGTAGGAYPPPGKPE